MAGTHHLAHPRDLRDGAPARTGDHGALSRDRTPLPAEWGGATHRALLRALPRGPQALPPEPGRGPDLGLCPRRDQSGGREAQLRVTKRGDAMLRRLLVSGAQYMLGPFGPDTDLRRWGLRLAARGGKNAKKRSVVAVARKLATLLHRLWISAPAINRCTRRPDKTDDSTGRPPAQTPALDRPIGRLRLQLRAGSTRARASDSSSRADRRVHRAHRAPTQSADGSESGSAGRRRPRPPRRP
ncbi:MAG: transposase [Gemmatimonadales bacterium]